MEIINDLSCAVGAPWCLRRSAYPQLYPSEKKKKIRRKTFSLTHFRLFILLCLPDTMKIGWRKFIRWSKSLTTMKRTLNDDGSEFSKFSDSHHQVADNGEDTTTTARSKKRRRRKKKRTRTQGRCRWEIISARNLRTMTRRENLCHIEFNHALVADWQQVEKRIFLFHELLHERRVRHIKNCKLLLMSFRLDFFLSQRVNCCEWESKFAHQLDSV